MFQRRSILLFSLILLLMLVLPQQGYASPQLVSGTPLVSPVPAGSPLATRPVSTAAFSLLGNTGGPLPLQEKFYVTLFSSSGMRQVTADLRYPLSTDPIGRLNIYVESGVSVDDWVIESIAREFEHTIHSVINEYFGTESDIDGNNQVTLLITALDVANISGYFDSRNQYSNQWVSNSNEREMIYINSRILGFGLDTVLQTLAHEFTHLVQWNYNWNYSPDNIWFAEGMAMYSGYLVGKVTGQTNYWDFSSIRAYLRSYSNISLIDWQQRYEDYGAAYAFMIYLSEHYSPGHLRRLFQDPRTNRLEALGEYLATYDTNLDDVLADWAVANAFDLSGTRYGYSDLSLGLGSSSLPELSGSSCIVPSWINRYWRLRNDGNSGLSIQLSGGPGLAARLVEKQPNGQIKVREFHKSDGELRYQRNPGTDISESILVVTNTGVDQRVDVNLGAPISPVLNLQTLVLPDLLLPGRYSVLVKGPSELDTSPSVEVSGTTGDKQLSIVQAWRARGLYLTEPFEVRTIGQGPVLLLVKGIKSGEELKMRETLQLD
jgi:hypothetical protein